MCRRNQLLGVAAIAFGLGLLVGSQMESGFLCGCVAIGLIALGVLWQRKR